MGYIESTIGAGAAQGLQNAYDRYLQRQDYRESRRRAAEEHQLKMDLARPTQQRANLESELLRQETEKMYRQQSMQMEAESMRRAVEDYMANPYYGGSDTLKRLKGSQMGGQLFGSFRNLEPAVLNYTPEAITQLAKEQGIDINEIMETPYKWSIITEDTADGTGNTTKYLANIEDVYALMGGNPGRFSIFQNQGKQNYDKFTAEHPEIMQPFMRYTQILATQNQNSQPTLDFDSTKFGRDFKDNILSKPGIETANAQADLMAKQIGLQNSMYELQALADYKTRYGDEAFTNLMLRQKKGANATRDTIDYLAGIYMQTGQAKDLNEALLKASDMVLGTAQMKNQAYFTGKTADSSAEDIAIDTLANEFKTDRSELKHTFDNLKNDDSYIDISAIAPVNQHAYTSNEAYKTAYERKKYNAAKFNLARLGGGNIDMITNAIIEGKTLDAEADTMKDKYLQDLIKYSGEDKEVRDFSKQIAKEHQYLTAVNKIITTDPITRAESQGLVDSIYHDLISYTPALDPASSEYAGAVRLLGFQSVDAFVNGPASDKDMARIDKAIGTLAKNEKDVLVKTKNFLEATRDSLERGRDRFRDKVIRAYVVDRRITGINKMLTAIDSQLYSDNKSKQSQVIATGNMQPQQVQNNVFDFDKDPGLAEKVKNGEAIINVGDTIIINGKPVTFTGVSE